MPAAVQNLKSSELVVATGGGVSVAPYGTPLPTEVDTVLNPAFLDLGYISEAGIALNAGTTVVDIGAFQRLVPVRRITTGRTFTATFALEQFNQESWAFAGGGGGKWTMVNPGSYRYDAPLERDATPEFSFVVDWTDGGLAMRVVLRRAQVTDPVTITLVNNAASTIPIVASVLGPDDSTLAPWSMLSKDVRFAIAS